MQNAIFYEANIAKTLETLTAKTVLSTASTESNVKVDSSTPEKAKLLKEAFTTWLQSNPTPVNVQIKDSEGHIDVFWMRIPMTGPDDPNNAVEVRFYRGTLFGHEVICLQSIFIPECMRRQGIASTIVKQLEKFTQRQGLRVFVISPVIDEHMVALCMKFNYKGAVPFAHYCVLPKEANVA